MSDTPFRMTPAATAALVQACRPSVPGMGFAVCWDSLRESAVDGPKQPWEGQMPDERLREFRLGRAALRGAMLEAGLPPVEVPREGRRPRLPPGATGSISHSGGVAVAVAGPRTRFLTLGVDLETEPLPLSSGKLFLDRDERAWVEAGGAAAAPCRLVRAFGAKEAVYKAFDQVPGRVGSAPPLDQLRLTPVPGGFAAWTRELPELLRVHVRSVGSGVLAWTWISAAGLGAPGPGSRPGRPVR